MPEITLNQKTAGPIVAAYDAVVSEEVKGLTNIVARYVALGSKVVPVLPAKGDDGKRPRGYFDAFMKAIADQGAKDWNPARISRAITIAEAPADRTLDDYRDRCRQVKDADGVAKPVSPTLTGFVAYIGGTMPAAPAAATLPAKGKARRDAAVADILKILARYELGAADIVKVLAAAGGSTD